MAKDITIKNSDGSVIYYPKTVSQLVYDNETGNTIKEIQENFEDRISTIENDFYEDEMAWEDYTEQLLKQINYASTYLLNKYRRTDDVNRVTLTQFAINEEIPEGTTKYRISMQRGKFARQMFSRLIEYDVITSSYELFNDTTYQAGTVEGEFVEGTKAFGILLNTTGVLRPTTIDDIRSLGLKIEFYTKRKAGKNKIETETIRAIEAENALSVRIDNIVDKGGDLAYYGEFIDVKKRTYDKISYMSLPTTNLTNIRTKFAELGKSIIRQSICTYNKYLIEAFTYGGIAVWDLDTKSLVCNFVLPLDDSVLNNTHCSNITFGTEFVEGYSDFPILYVCETTGNRRCFVIAFDKQGNCTLVQTIQFNGTWGTENDYRDFIVDAEKGEMWIVGYYNYNVSGNHTIVKKVDLRSVTVGDITYTDSDVQKSFTIPDIRVIQGVFICNGHLYIGDQRCWIVNIDLSTGAKVGHINFRPHTAELEGICAWDNSILVDLGTLYQLKLY